MSSKTYRQRVENKLCGHCGEKPKEGYSSCQSCIDKLWPSNGTTTDRRLAKGLCIRCGDCPPKKGCKTCAPCLERHKQMRKVSKRYTDFTSTKYKPKPFDRMMPFREAYRLMPASANQLELLADLGNRETQTLTMAEANQLIERLLK